MAKQQSKEYYHQYYLKNKERIKLRTKRYQIEHREQVNKKSEDWRKRNLERARLIQRNFYHRHRLDLLRKRRAYYAINKERINGRSRELGKINRVKTKIEVLTHYGGELLQCLQCGENRIDCLSLDHIENNGYEHRKRLSFKGSYFYTFLKSNEYPLGYQTLCMNCQWIKKAEHQRQRRLLSKS